MNDGSQSSAGVIQFFSNPIVGLVGSLASIAGLVLAVYFYVHSARYRDLTYLVHPTKTVVVKSGQSSRLSVLLDGRTIGGDITAAQIAFWNNGKESIRREHVLAPFIIKVGAPIIDARIRKKSRKIVSIALNPSRMAIGELNVTWDILEQDDGGVIQIIFAGGTETLISADAVIESQPKISEVALSDPGTLENRDAHKITIAQQIAVFSVSVFMMVAGIPRLVRQRRRGAKVSWRDYLMVIIIPIIFAIIMAITLLSDHPGPPFGF